MEGDVIIGDEAPGREDVDTLYAAAFSEEDLAALVSALLALDAGVISVTARAHGALIGHGLLSLCGVEGGGQAALLGPLAVSPGHQRRGVGGALIKAGVERARGSGASHVLVLGDPAYYGRFGFEPEHRIAGLSHPGGVGGSVALSHPDPVVRRRPADRACAVG